CANKLKQLSLAYTSYLTDNEGRLAPLASYPDDCSPAGIDSGDGGYYGFLAEYLGDSEGNSTFWHRHGWAEFDKADSRNAVYFCPSSSNELEYGTGSGKYTNYGYNNGVIAIDENSSWGNPGGPKNVSQLSSPSKTLFVFDGYYNGMNSTVYIETRITWEAHSSGANISYMDGHAARQISEAQYDWDWFAKTKLNSTHFYYY
ncbi:MAG: hypothetical protein ACYTFY_16570, partial [Planctomycetota bacterium]